jgi:hypothetical protein
MMQRHLCYRRALNFTVLLRKVFQQLVLVVKDHPAHKTFVTRQLGAELRAMLVPLRLCWDLEVTKPGKVLHATLAIKAEINTIMYCFICAGSGAILPSSRAPALLYRELTFQVLKDAFSLLQTRLSLVNQFHTDAKKVFATALEAGNAFRSQIPTIEAKYMAMVPNAHEQTTFQAYIKGLDDSRSTQVDPIEMKKDRRSTEQFVKTVFRILKSVVLLVRHTPEQECLCDTIVKGVKLLKACVNTAHDRGYARRSTDNATELKTYLKLIANAVKLCQKHADKS